LGKPGAGETLWIDGKRRVMSAPVTLWIEIVHHTAFLYGGWAYVRRSGGAVAGYAGGERSLDVQRLTLTALIASLEGLAPGGGVAVQTSGPLVAGVLRLAIAPPAPGSDEAPSEHLDLWARLQILLKGRAVTVQTVKRAPNTPAAFLAAWAEVGQDKAKASAAGRFSAAIPKPNLAKLILN
jgi:hypothetical protein